MSAYTRPQVDYVAQLCGLHESIQGLEEADLTHQLALQIAGCERVVAFSVGETVFDATDLTERQALAYADAVAYRAGARVLRAVAVQKVTGTQEPNLMEDSAAMMALADYLDAQADAIVNASQGTEDVGGELVVGTVTSTELLDSFRPQWQGQTDVEVR